MLNEKSKSKKQQHLMALALQIKQGDMTKDDFDSESLYNKAKEIADSMSMSDLEDYAETDRKGLPDEVEENIKVNISKSKINKIIKKTFIKKADKVIDESKENKLRKYIREKVRKKLIKIKKNEITY